MAIPQHRPVTIRGKRFTASTTNSASFWQLWENEGWQKGTLDVFERFVQPDKAVIDIGAWAGPLSLFAAHLTRGPVHAVEPDPAIYPELETNRALNPDLADRLFAHQVAIGTEDGTAQLFSRREFGDSSSSLISRSRDGGGAQEVKTMRIETLAKHHVQEPVGFVKMDVEGAEFELIPEMAHWLATQKPNLHLSLHGHFLVEQYFRQKGPILRKAGPGLEDRFGQLWSKKWVNRRFRKLIRALEFYPYWYLENKEEVKSSDWLNGQPPLAPTELVLTTEPW